MDMRMVVLICLAALSVRFTLGYVSEYINTIKGYKGGFWWGFLLGSIGFMIVASKPPVQQNCDRSNQDSALCRAAKRLLRDGGYK